MSVSTIELLRFAVDDVDTCTRYRDKVATVPGMACPLIWTGAISGKGHGRFWLGQTTDRKGATIIAHRFAYALAHGVDALLDVELLSHRCDNPLCQTVGHLQARTNADNRREWAQRRHSPGNPLRDVRGARGRAEAIRDAARHSGDPVTVGQTGLGEDLLQGSLFDEAEPTR